MGKRGPRKQEEYIPNYELEAAWNEILCFDTDFGWACRLVAPALQGETLRREAVSGGRIAPLINLLLSDRLIDRSKFADLFEPKKGGRPKKDADIFDCARPALKKAPGANLPEAAAPLVAWLRDESREFTRGECRELASLLAGEWNSIGAPQIDTETERQTNQLIAAGKLRLRACRKDAQELGRLIVEYKNATNEFEVPSLEDMVAELVRREIWTKAKRALSRSTIIDKWR